MASRPPSPPPPPRAPCTPPAHCNWPRPCSAPYACLSRNGRPGDRSAGCWQCAAEARGARRRLDTANITRHFYPEGGWGWIVCGAAFLAHVLSAGLQLAFGALHVYALRHFGPSAEQLVWAGALCVSTSRAAGALASGRAPRLAALLGGTLLPLACLYTSFATQLHQVIISYGVVLGVGCGLVREAAGLVLGTYFRKRRQFVELVAHSGTGVGVALFSVAYKEALGKLGWRLGLQAITGFLVLTFFLGAVYRSASLYHPHRRAILHLKNQRRKIKLKKQNVKQEPLIELSALKSRAPRMLLLSSFVAALGLYTPVVFLTLQGRRAGVEDSGLVLLQTFIGFASVLGCAGAGLLLLRPSPHCLVSNQYLCQAALVGIGISELALSNAEGYHGYVLICWMFGLSLGAFLYSMKMLVMERVRSRHFSKVWSFVQGAEVIPIIVSVPITSYLNQHVAKSSFYFSAAATFAGALLLFFVGYSKKDPDVTTPAAVAPQTCGCTTPPRCEVAWCGCGLGSATTYCAWTKPACQSRFSKSLSYMPLEHTCCSDTCFSECCRQYTPLRPSRSVPEGLCRAAPPLSRSNSCRICSRKRENHLIEQITTSV